MKRSQRGRDRGQSLVEFALLLPLLLLILFGVIDFGRAIFTYSTLAEGARQGDRLAVVDQTAANVRAATLQSMPAVTLDADPNGFRLCFKKETATTETQLSCTNTASSTLCNGGTDPKLIGCLAVVETTSTFQPITPGISSVVGPIVLTSRSVNPIEFVCPTTANPSPCP